MGAVGRARRGEAGQDLVEYALTAILFFTVLFGVMDAAWIFWNYETVAEATRVGARFAITHCCDEPSVEAAVQARAFGVTLDADDIQVAWPNGAFIGEPVRVSVDYQATPFTTLLFGGLPLNLHAESTMEIQH